MKIAHYLHINSKENISDCLTKHLSHLQLWALIKEYLFYCWTGPEKVVTFSLSACTEHAPDGECQAGNSLGQEHAVHVQSEPQFAFSESLHLPSTGQCYLATDMIGGQCSIVPVYFGNQALTNVNQNPLKRAGQMC
jgi:hypothetical protein